MYGKGTAMSVVQPPCRSAAGAWFGLIAMFAGEASSVAAAPLPNAPVASPAEAKSDPAPSDDPPVVVEVQPSPRRARWFGTLRAGAAYRWALRESLVGGVFEGELGAQDHRLAGGVRLRVEAGKMRAGLPYQVVTIGPSLWLPPIADRLRVGMGLEAGAFLLSRRSDPGAVMWTVAWGGRLDAAVDLARVGTTGGVYFAVNVAAQALTAAPFPVTVVTGAAFGYRP